MPLKELSEEEVVAGLKALKDDIAFLLEEKRIEKNVRALMGHLGMDSLEVYSHSFTSESELRESLKTDFGIDPTEGLPMKRTAALLVGVWHTSKTRVKSRDDADAEARIEGRPRELAKVDHIGLRRAYEAIHEEIDDAVFPSQEYNNGRIGQIEEGEYKAEPLSHIVSVKASGEEGADVESILALMKTGTVRTTKVRVKVPMPVSPEELRSRYDTMTIHWDLMKMRFPERPAFRGLDEKVWRDLVNYILGAQVHGYKSSKGVKLSWADTLEYEHEIRKRAFRKVTSDPEVTLRDAIKEARTNNELRTTHFALQLVTSGVRERSRSPRRPRDPPPPRPHPAPPAHKGAGKGKSKGKNKAKEGGALGYTTPEAAYYKTQLALEKFKPKALDNHLICVKFNKAMCQWGQDCKFSHSCLRCGQAGHRLYACTAAISPK